METIEYKSNKLIEKITQPDNSVTIITDFGELIKAVSDLDKRVKELENEVI
jgi:polyhydroxyalkanoate synthesis regulator phasin